MQHAGMSPQRSRCHANPSRSVALVAAGGSPVAAATATSTAAVPAAAGQASIGAAQAAAAHAKTEGFTHCEAGSGPLHKAACQASHWQSQLGRSTGVVS